MFQVEYYLNLDLQFCPVCFDILGVHFEHMNIHFETWVLESSGWSLENMKTAYLKMLLWKVLYFL